MGNTRVPEVLGRLTLSQLVKLANWGSGPLGIGGSEVRDTMATKGPMASSSGPVDPLTGGNNAEESLVVAAIWGIPFLILQGSND